MSLLTGRLFFHPLVLTCLVLLTVSCQASSDLIDQQSAFTTEAESTAVIEVIEAVQQVESEETADLANSQPTATHSSSPDPLAGTTPEPIFVETPPQQILPLEIVDQGFGQVATQIGYGFLVTNPNPDLAIADVGFQVSALDATGSEVATDFEYLSLILPDQTIGIAGNIQLDENIPVSDVEFQIIPGQPYFADTSPELEITSITYHPGSVFNHVTGVIRNNGPLDLEDLRISAIAYNQADEIIGAGYTFLSFLLADTSMGVDITLNVDGIVHRVELYPRPSLNSLFDVKRSPMAKLVLLDSGFSQDDIEVTYGFIVENPSQSFALEDSEYQMTAYDAQSNVLTVEEGFFSLLLPGQTLGFGNTFFVEEGEEVDHITIQLNSGKNLPLVPQPFLEVVNLRLVDDGLTTLIRGEIANPFDVDLEDIRASSVVFDEDGLIVGGGFTWLDHVPSNGRSALEIPVSSSGNPVSAEIYATMAELIESE